jgi:hypothetical protein
METGADGGGAGAGAALDTLGGGTVTSTMVANWTERLELVRPSYWSTEPILALHRCILELVKDIGEEPDLQFNRVQMGKLWLESARLARHEGLLQTAYMCVISTVWIRPFD